MKTKLLAAILHLPILLFLLFSNVTLTSAQGNATSDCKPYSIPLDPVACGQGYTGVKFPLKVKTCPGGLITIGQSYNTENCKRVGETPNPNATNCALTPTDIACTSAPSPMGCPAGQHWVTTGSGIAHCVQNDFPCPWGQSLKHDALGNPYCVPNSCPSNQVLQPDGISCACSAGLVWDGASCIAACTPSSYTESASCSAGFSGTMSRIVTNTCPSGTPSYGAWNTSSCVPNAVSCPADDYVPTACLSGSGTAYAVYTYVGSSCVRTYAGRDDSGCSSGSTCPADTSFSSSCGPGFSGQQVTTTSYSGASCTPSTYTDTSACVPQGGGGGGSPTCTVTTGSENGYPCPATYTGWVFRNWTQDSCTGRTYGDWDYSACVKVPDCTSTTMTEVQSCPSGYSGNQTRIVTTNSCTGSSTYSSWDDTNCIAMNKPIVFVSESLWRKPSQGEPDPSRCSFEVWIFGYKDGNESKGRGYEFSAEMIAKSDGYMDWNMGAPGICILY